MVLLSGDQARLAALRSKPSLRFSLFPLARSESANLGGQRRHPPRSPAEEQRATLLRRANASQASVLRVCFTGHETGIFQGRDEPRHRRRPYLLGVRQLAQRQRPAKYDDRECGEPRRAEA